MQLVSRMKKCTLLCLLYLWPLNFPVRTVLVSSEVWFDSYKMLVQTVLWTVCVISVVQTVSLVALQRWYLKIFRGQLEKVVLSITSAFLLHYIQMEFPTA